MFSKIKKETLRKSKIQPTEYEKSEAPQKSRPPSRLYSIPPSCAARLSQDMASIVNNSQDSDVQFKVGGDDVSILQENSKTTYDESMAVTFNAHSLILRCRSRYFATMLDEKNWGESSKCVIYKPHISPGTFQEVLHYIYTGDVRAKQFKTIIQLIAVADEMDLEGLGVECQDKLLRKVKNIFSDDYDSDEEDEYDEILKESIKRRTPIDTAVCTNIIQALNLAGSLSLTHFSQKLLTIIIPYMPEIIESPNTYATFIDKISSEDLAKIIESDKLEMEECDIWSLALDWACHQTKLSKTSVEERLNTEENDDEKSDGKKISSSQLNNLKAMLAPLLPAIRFSLFKPDDYARMVYIINYFLSRRRSLELQQYFMNFMKTDRTRQLDAPRVDYTPQEKPSKIISSLAWKFLRRNIFETGGIAGCPSLGDLKFELLFRASEHGFRITTFHQHCDNKGPTLSIFRSADGHLFGGVNFNNCKSDSTWSSSVLNFLFALPDGHHRKDSAIFRIIEACAQYSFHNNPSWGHCFGNGYDLAIADSANINESSYSNLPHDYSGSGASNTALAGAQHFKLSDYEVFAISK